MAQNFTPQATITEERIKFLHTINPKDANIFHLAQRWRAALNERDQRIAANAIRRYIPQALNLIWIAQDAQRSRARRYAFNPIRFDASYVTSQRS